MNTSQPMDHPDNSYLIENMAREFWEMADDAGESGRPPRDIKTAITLALPLEVYPVPALRVSHILAWTRRVQMPHRIRGRDRRLHGCLLADRGKGTIFVDASDADDEQRFTLAHELAHFLLDYQFPRQRAVNILGPSIRPVLDGERAPTLAERVHAVMSSVHLGTLSHVMERPESGLPPNMVLDIEDRADRLALELLAPVESVCALLQQPTAPRGFDARLAYVTQLLTRRYGLPPAIAAVYARYVLARLGEPTFRDWLFGS
jgi:IrrE N-terminal-like domain